MTDRQQPAEPQNTEPFGGIASMTRVNDAIGEYESNPRTARNKSLKTILGELQRARNAAQTETRRDNLEEIERFIKEVREVKAHEATIPQMRMEITDIYANELEKEDLDIGTIPADIPQYLQDIVTTLRNDVKDLPQGQGQRVAAEKTIDYLIDAKKYVTEQDYEKIKSHLDRILEYRKVLGPRFSLVKTALSQSFVAIIEEKCQRGQLKPIDAARIIWEFAYDTGIVERLTIGGEGLKELNQIYVERVGLDHFGRKKGHEAYSQFSLSESDVETLLKGNPFDLLDNILRRIESSRDPQTDQIAQSAIRDLQILMSQFGSRQFREQQWPNSSFAKEYRGSFQDFLQEVQSIYHSRYFGHILSAAIRKADFRSIQEQSGLLGSYGIFEAIKIKGVQVAFNRFEQRIEQKRLVLDKYNLNHIEKTRINNKLVRDLKDEIFRELNAHREFYGFRSENEVQTAVNVAYNVFVNTQREALYSSKGKAPAEDQSEGGLHAFVAEPEDHIARIFSVLDFGFDKYSQIQDTQKKAILGNLLSFVGLGDQEIGRRRVNDMLQQYDVMSSGWRTDTILKHLKSVYINEYGSDVGEKIFETLALGVKLKRNGKNHRWGVDGAYGKLVDDWQNIAKYRPQEILKIFAETVRYKMKSNKKTNVLEFDYDPKTGKKVVDPSKPNAFVELMRNGLDLGVFDASGKVRKAENYTELENFVGNYFYAINDRLMYNKVNAGGQAFERDPITGQRKFKGLPGIDYSRDLKDQPFGSEIVQRQQEIIDEVFKELTPNGDWQKARDTYLATMKKMTDFGTGKTNVRVRGAKHTDMQGNMRVTDELIKNLEYEWIYSNHVRFFDDARLAELQDQGNSRLLSLSAIYGETGGRDMFARAWGDTGSSSQALQNLTAMLMTLDQEELIKNARQFHDMVKDVEGPKEAMTGVAYILGAWMKGAKVSPGAALLGLDQLPFGRYSEFQKQLGPGAPALNPHELRKLRTQLDQFVGNLEEFVPDKELWKKFQSESGTQSWVQGAYYMRIILLFIIFFLLQEAMKEAQKVDQAA